jgi:hypothetical protein
MMTAAQQAEKDAESYKTQLFNIEKELDDLFTEKAKFNTPESKELDEYSDIVIKINDLASESDRIRLMYDQAKTLVLSFGSKANIFKKFRMQFKFYLSAVKNRVKDFDATVKMLKVDFDATSAMSSGTDAVKNALLFSDQWEVAYATDLVQNAVAYNIANTSSNIVDIKDIMGSIGANTNPEQAFEKLKLLTGNIERGIDIIPQAKRYANPELKLNSEEKKASGFGEGVF